MENEPGHDFEAVRSVDEWDARLCGYEPQSEPLCPHRTEEYQQILRALHSVTGTDFRLVRDRRGKLTVWRRAHDFWG